MAHEEQKSAIEGASGAPPEDAVLATMEALDRGELRVASPPAEGEGEWTVHAWVKKAILAYFRLAKMETMEIGPFEFHDKIPLKSGLDAQGVRVVPPGTARYGSHLEPGAIL
ncbi:MAG: 2,3,4,5-tetrahydropyridine-2,6-dicarboxylate N-succinyltransferase, partial [Myxococcota bacterium]